MLDHCRVVVTGLGAITPIGMAESDIWARLMAGDTGIRRLSSLDPTAYKCSAAGEVDDAWLEAGLKAINQRPSDRTTDMALIAAAQALEQSGLLKESEELKDMGAIIGTGVGSSQSWYIANRALHEKGLRGLRPTTVPRCMANAPAAALSLRFGLGGPNYAVTSACSSSTEAIGIAYRMIRDGYARTVLCGGVDCPFDPFVFGAWNNLGVMSKHPDPRQACRPFDRQRDGCVLGEGAGILVLESLDHATARGASIRAEICGFGESSDATHMTRPNAEGQARAITAALSSDHTALEEVGFVSAHGTATRVNDPTESSSIRLALGPCADDVPVASHKSYLGHLLGASGAVETIIIILSLEHECIPRNLNLDDPDPECILNYVTSDSEPLTKPVALKNSFGFGGNNAVLVLRKWL